MIFIELKRYLLEMWDHRRMELEHVLMPAERRGWKHNNFPLRFFKQLLAAEKKNTVMENTKYLQFEQALVRGRVNLKFDILFVEACKHPRHIRQNSGLLMIHLHDRCSGIKPCHDDMSLGCSAEMMCSLLYQLYALISEIGNVPCLSIKQRGDA